LKVFICLTVGYDTESVNKMPAVLSSRWSC